VEEQKTINREVRKEREDSLNAREEQKAINHKVHEGEELYIEPRSTQRARRFFKCEEKSKRPFTAENME